MKMKIMNVCGMAILAIGIWACSGQKKGTANVEVATDSVEVAADTISVQADSTGYIVRVGEMAPDFTITLTDGKQVSLSPFVVRLSCCSLLQVGVEFVVKKCHLLRRIFG